MEPGTTPMAPTPPPKALVAMATSAYASQARHPREDQWIVDHLPLVRHIVLKVVDVLAYSSTAGARGTPAYQSVSRGKFR